MTFPLYLSPFSLASLLMSDPSIEELASTEVVAAIGVWMSSVEKNVNIGFERARIKNQDKSEKKAMVCDLPMTQSDTNLTLPEANQLQISNSWPFNLCRPSQDSEGEAAAQHPLPSQAPYIQGPHSSQRQGQRQGECTHKTECQGGHVISPPNFYTPPSPVIFSSFPMNLALSGSHNAKRKKAKKLWKQNNSKSKTPELTCKIHNLSKADIPEEEIQTLAVGTNFIPTPKTSDSVISEASNHFIRSAYLKYKFQSEESEIPKWWIPSDYQPKTSGSFQLDQMLRQFAQKLYKMPKTPAKANWTKQQQALLSKLLQREDILVITADKNLGYAIVDKEWYITQSLSHLENAKVFVECTDSFNQKDKGLTTMSQIYDTLSKLILQHKDCLDTAEVKWILNKREWSPMPFYLLAKVHKKPVKGRPIIPTQNWITYHLSKWLAAELNPFMMNSHIILRDSLDLINTLEHDMELKYKLSQAKENIWLISADVEALYPNINTNRGIMRLTRMLQEKGHATPDRRAFIGKALNLVLKQNFVQFQNRVFKQVNGTAMGTPLGPQYANLFMLSLEEETVSKWMTEGLALYKRFIDDIFAIFIGTEAKALEFIQELNSLDPDIKLTHSLSQESVNFLDITILADKRLTKEGRLSTKVYQKELNEYLYVPFHSYHTDKQKSGFIKGECIRYIRNSSSKKDYEALVKLFKQRLLKRGYPINIIDKGIAGADYKERATYLKIKPKDKSTVPLIFKIQHNPRVNHQSLRKELNQLAIDLGQVDKLPGSLTGHITICYKLPKRLHAQVLKARADKGF